MAIILALPDFKSLTLNRGLNMVSPFDWIVLKSRHLVKDRWISVRSDTCQMPNGTIVDPYYVLEYPTWVNVVALTKKQEIILVKQYRHGLKQTILELPSGAVKTEDVLPMEAAKRELLEETGYTSNHFIETGILDLLQKALLQEGEKGKG
ncbi:MAG: NUDIX hydrolase [Nostoc sp.]|uniref:NUDIX hydrolase n=1 Tax=Nostoc sp. TaxID=1180 RepID=UPI002FF54FC6